MTLYIYKFSGVDLLFVSLAGRFDPAHHQSPVNELERQHLTSSCHSAIDGSLCAEGERKRGGGEEGEMRERLSSGAIRVIFILISCHCTYMYIALHSTTPHSTPLLMMHYMYTTRVAVTALLQ